MNYLQRLYTLKVTLFIIAITIFLTSKVNAQQLAGAYTIGGDNPDFAKISDAATALDTSGISAAVTFNIRPGVYEENAGADRVLHISQQITGVSAANIVTFQPDIASGGTVDNVTLRRIVGPYDEKGWIAEIRSDGVSLNELTFEYADTSTVAYHPNTSFALVFFQSGGVTAGINDITVTGCKLLRTSSVQRSPQGIFVFNEASNITITNNLIDGSKDGIILAGSSSFRSNTTISGNTILNLQTTVTAVGNWQGYGIRIERAKDDVIIRNNIIDYRNGFGVTGIDVAENTGALLIESNQILNGQNNHWNQRLFNGISYNAGFGQARIINNMVSSRSPGSGIHINAPNCLVSFNTVVQTSTGVVRLERAQVFDMSKSGNTVTNNIFIQLFSGDIDGGVMQIADTTGNIIDYNCIYKAENDGIFVKANGATYTSFNNWQDSGNGTHSLEKYPEFVHILIDLHLDGCSIYDPELQVALPDAAVQLDMDGETRDLETPFFGADEAEGTLPEIFSKAKTVLTNDEALHFTSGDLDGDGDNDIAVVNGTNGSNDISLFLNDGFGDFSVPIHLPFGSQPEVIGAVDIDNDNAVDLFATTAGKLALRYGSPGANFDTEIDLPYQTDVEGFLFIDLDNDLDLDIFQTHLGTVGVSDGEVTQLINVGSRNFLFANQGSFNAGQYPSTAASGHLNNDSFLDVAVVDFVNGTVSVLINKGIDNDGIWLGFLSGGQYTVSSGSSPLHANLAIGDIDGDDHAEILVGVWGVASDGLALLRNKGDGSFFPKEDFFIDDKRYSETFSLFDYEGDSDLDLIVATQRHDLIFFRNDGAGNFEQFLLCQDSKLSGEPLSLLITQLNKEVLPDVAVLTISDDITIMLNRNFTDAVTNVNQPLVAIPQVITLEQNYPNPFNPTTTISYELQQAGIVTLKVFDLRGREVATLVRGEKSAGSHSIIFDASKLASGVYVYRFEAGRFRATRKMALIR